MRRFASWISFLSLVPPAATTARAETPESDDPSAQVCIDPGPSAAAYYVGSFGVAIDVPACGANLKRIDQAIRGATYAATTCLAYHNPGLAYRFLSYLAKRTPEIHCVDPATFASKAANLDSGAPQTGGNHHCALGEVGGNRVYLHPVAFVPSVCGPLSEVLFHEFLHNISVTTTPYHQPGDTADGVYGCELTCFAKASPTMPASALAARVSACENAH